MKVKIFFPGTIYIVIVVAAFAFLTGCGTDESAPSIDTSTIPQTVFFNDTGSTEYYLFQGRATDNTNVDTVFVSGNNGASWNTAVIDNSPPNKDHDVQWFYLASSGVISAGIHTVLVRAADRDGNETISDPVIVNVSVGSTTGSLLAVFTGPLPGGVVGLSTGEGFAYGNSSASLTIPVSTNLTVLGSGYGDMLTSGGHSPPGNSIGTFLDASSTTASLFSVNADLTIRNVRLLGAENAVRIWDSAGPDPQLSVQDCLFDRQSGWAVYAEDDDAAVSVEILDSFVDASRADSPSGEGGLYLDNINYTVTNSRFYSHSPTGGGIGIQAVSGAGVIDSSIFDGNAMAIWASGGSPIITSCNISGAAFTTNGINLTGGPGEAIIRRNTIDGHTGGYGLRVGGEMELTLRNNEITNNELSGVLIDSELSNVNLVNIDMGTTGDKGNNHFSDNTHPDGDVGLGTQVYVTLATQEGSTRIPANWNYWGASTPAEVNIVITDGNDDPARATLAIGSFWLSPGGEVGP
jgi:hypothetical protein